MSNVLSKGAELDGKGWESLAPVFADKLRKPLEGAAGAHWRRFSEGGVMGTTPVYFLYLQCVDIWGACCLGTGCPPAMAY